MILKGEMKKKILIVDDDISGRLLEYNLEKEGYEVYSATNGKEAIVKAEKAKPDLIITDIMMPRMDGFEFLERLRSDKKTRAIPVVFVTARGQASDIKNGLKLGVDAYITKPFDTQDLLKKIKYLFKK